MATATARTAMQSTTSEPELEEVATSDREDDRLLDARQVAAKLGVSERFIRDHTTRRSPRIPGVKLGKLLRYRAADVAIFMAELNTQPSSRRS
ncbi:MAG TPA: helix-turn-helix domain-containing protein [Acidisarcina sp.]|nr:helix-turn-helix domain-containing protein [Acidisarcina sp.]